ncbi:hypothetical protein RE432_12280 [Pusillimonas sp. SM2304]|uniref:hypothetical protein n=1 Tax=Pusillimonas sp. SM2304 TaxID=3073241 RepID=UPI0028749BEA|nr:hypothetical protein [Pusillimonas sp. SM2304]MDS1141210.1 hypothetical protein [Pusillimonas sp. SM2304]
MMHTRSTQLTRHALTACALGACLMAPAAYAANSGNAQTEADINARYQLDVERCNTGQTNQDKATCLREAGAAREEARRNRLTSSNQAYDQNQTKRCDALPAGERDDCLLQMSGQNTATQNTTTQGSIGGGGVLRETTITIPGQPTSPSSPGLTPVTPTPMTPTPAIPAPPDTLTPAMPSTAQ